MHQLRAPQPAAAGRTSRRWLGAIATAAVIAGPMLSGGFAAVAANPAAVTVGVLRIDNRDDQPLGLDDTTPVLSWQLAGRGPDARQSAYEVRVADGTGRSLWDTGKVTGSVAQVEYDGAPLVSRAEVSWQVRVWDGDGDASAWSDASRFEMGLLDKSDWGDATWIQSRSRRPTGARRSTSVSSPAATSAWTSPSWGCLSTSPPTASSPASCCRRWRSSRPTAPTSRSAGTSRSTTSSPAPAAAPSSSLTARSSAPATPAGSRPPRSHHLQMDPDRPRLGPDFRPRRALPAHRCADAGGADPSLPGRLHRARLIDRCPDRRPTPQDGHRPAEPPRSGHQQPAAHLREALRGREEGRRRAPVRRRPRRLRGHGQRPEGHRHRAQPRGHQPPAVRRVRHLRRHRPRRGRRQHAGGRARERAGQRVPAGQRRDGSYRRLHEVQPFRSPPAR